VATLSASHRCLSSALGQFDTLKRGWHLRLRFNKCCARACGETIEQCFDGPMNGKRSHVAGAVREEMPDHLRRMKPG